ncbi:large-conductance mechanosensitive channel, MscL family protein [Mycobacterium xenopi 4042]|uniref:Large-conductance mechanosensitive channel, MscL family protein n=1 Tax=Mycobacterium xenopi 4042 TaxID=1299334 RepID=X8AGN9_MYCXE|nr:large-conductance mechanosensitive channel, MscL family protein [Mycobacterium xenopi 4042]
MARVFKGFKDFLMRGDVITVAVGLVVALAFSNLVKAFTDSVINPLVAAAQPHHPSGWVGNSATRATRPPSWTSGHSSRRSSTSSSSRRWCTW